jgi:Transcriptional regulator, AbiEi antitoxin
MRPKTSTQHDRAVQLLQRQGLVRRAEFVAAGITAATIARMEQRGEVMRVGRGVYQLPDHSIDANYELALAAKLVPSGVICLVSALAFHELTDSIPSHVWMAIGSKDRKPAVVRPRLQTVRFSTEMLRRGFEHHLIDGVNVPITTPARTVVDLFRYRAAAGRRFQNSPGLNLALEGLREVLRQRKATPAEIAFTAEEVGIWKVMRPYLEAMTSHA